MKHHISFKHALDGIFYCIKTQPNFRFHLIAAFTAVALGFYFHIYDFEWLLVAFTILLVIVAEMLNTAVEAMTDLITKEHRLEAKIAKDVSAGMVLLTATGAIVVGVMIFLPYLITVLELK